MASIKIPCLTATQGKISLVFFTISAKKLFGLVEINQRDPDKETGYQRALSGSRVTAIKKYIEQGNPIPLNVLIAFDAATKVKNGHIEIPNQPNAGWVIDGQHRLAGAYESDVDIDLPVVAFLGITEQEQIKQFITINQEAKGVPKSLYYDLLRHLPPDKNESELAKERAVDIANELKKDENSPFYSKIVISAPKSGQVSLNNFVRKLSPLFGKSGFFKQYTIKEQSKIINNYYIALRNTFPEFFEYKNPVLLKTVGFGAVINILPTIFQLTLKRSAGFTIDDISKIFTLITDFDFNSWNGYGTGTAAEKQAGDDLMNSIIRRIGDEDESSDSATLRL